MYSYDDHVFFSRTDENRRMKLTAIVDAMQDCSCRHSDSIGFGRDYLTSAHRAWLLNSWQIIFDRYPKEGEDYTVETRPWKFERFYGYRNFTLTDAEGKYLARANSRWFYVDTERMRPVRPEEDEVLAYGIDEPVDMPYFTKHKLTIPEKLTVQESFPVRRSNLDSNHHVNNAQYILMAEEYFPADREIAELRVEYRTAAKYGDRIVPRIGTDEDGWFTVVLGDEAGDVYAVVKGITR